ncbi:MAG: SH3 domain-containing protein [Anaerolineae bacterium]|nr:SH3 domain-containing protein [Anaerolineae bacterium]
MATCRAIIRGLPETPTLTEINVRSGPGTSFAIVFKAPVGLSGLDVLDAQADADGRGFQGKTYTWLKLRFPNGQEAWARDDLLDLEPGDCSEFGYPRTGVRTFLFTLTRVPGLARTTLADVPDDTSTDTSVDTPVDVPIDVPVDTPVDDDVPVDVPDDGVPAGCAAYTLARDRVNMRSGPGPGFAAVAQLVHNTKLDVLDVRPEQGSGPLRWVQVGWSGRTGWIREDWLRYEGLDCVPHGLGYAPDHYPAPLAPGGYWWIRGFTGPQPDHPGWDLGARQGESIRCGPAGGWVLTSFQASKPTLDKPSVKDHGIPVGTPSIFSDPGWGYGYGHYVVVRYLNEQLPTSTREALATQGRAGWHVFCMYAHLQRRAVEAEVELAPGQAIGACGTTGNSEAPHLHLEIRIHRDANERIFGRMLPGLMDPALLFNK